MSRSPTAGARAPSPQPPPWMGWIDLSRAPRATLERRCAFAGRTSGRASESAASAGTPSRSEATVAAPCAGEARRSRSSAERSCPSAANAAPASACSTVATTSRSETASRPARSGPLWSGPTRRERAQLLDLVDESIADGGGLGAHAKRLDRFANGKRTFAVRMANYLGTREPRRAVKCARCANLLHFRHYLDHDRLALVGGYFCGQWKLCLTCAIKRGAKALGDLTPILVDQLQRDPQLRAYLVTLTVKNAPGMSEAECRERFDHLRASLRRYMERRNDARKKRRGYVEANKAIGIHWSIEMGRGANSGGWHPHVHAVWVGRHRPNPIALSDEWGSVTGDSFVVDVREFACTKRGGERTSDAIARDVVEVCKYTLKPHEMTAADAYAAQLATAGAHFVGRVGTLRLSIEERERVRVEHAPKLDGRFVDLFYRYAERAGRYVEFDDGLARGSAPGAPVLEHDDPLRRLGAREVNRQLAPVDRASVVARFDARASRGARGASPELDTRAILGDSGPPPDPGPPADRGHRLASAPSAAEDLFAG